ncbi:MAG: hypothetical protein HY822_01390 [Acidobacteria bacterium]|nr:hypothetical protein [Acidobacteriota bacterium]
MSLSVKLPILLLAASAAFAADKDNGRFKPGPANSYPARQTIEQVTIAAVPYHAPDLAREAFGKLKLLEYGVLPILVVIQNDSNQALRLEWMRVEYLSGGGKRIEATPASDVRYIGSGQKRFETGAGGRPRLGGGRKNPLDAWEIEGRALVVKMLPAGEKANGFFYFQAAHREGAQLYISGIQQAGTGKDLFYFEIPLER